MPVLLEYELVPEFLSSVLLRLLAFWFQKHLNYGILKTVIVRKISLVYMLIQHSIINSQADSPQRRNADANTTKWRPAIAYLGSQPGEVKRETIFYGRTAKET